VPRLKLEALLAVWGYAETRLFDKGIDTKYKANDDLLLRLACFVDLLPGMKHVVMKATIAGRQSAKDECRLR